MTENSMSNMSLIVTNMIVFWQSLTASVVIRTTAIGHERKFLCGQGSNFWLDQIILMLKYVLLKPLEFDYYLHVPPILYCALQRIKFSSPKQRHCNSIKCVLLAHAATCTSQSTLQCLVSTTLIAQRRVGLNAHIRASLESLLQRSGADRMWILQLRHGDAPGMKATDKNCPTVPIRND